MVGLGGVGSWTVEALARGGIGGLVLIDGDEVCLSNTNRQLQAVEEAVGRPKAEVLAARVRAIHPDCRVEARVAYYRGHLAEELLEGTLDFIVDAIDGVMPKASLIAAGRARGIPVVSCGGAGGRRDPARVSVSDLAATHGDRLLFHVRKQLRRHFGFPGPGRPFGVPCVHSAEPPYLPPGCDRARAGDADPFGEEEGGLNCNGRLGAATPVTGVFGFHAAAVVLNTLAQAE